MIVHQANFEKSLVLTMTFRQVFTESGVAELHVAQAWKTIMFQVKLEGLTMQMWVASSRWLAVNLRPNL